MGSKLAKKLLAAGGKGSILLLAFKPSEYLQAGLRAASGLSGASCIYVSMGRLWREVNEALEKMGADTSKFYWIGGTGVGFWSKDSALKGGKSR